MLRKNPFDLTGKVGLVTGGNSGLGLGFAKGMASAGADVVIWGRRSDQNEIAAQELREYGVKVLAQSVDVSSEEQVVRGMKEAVQAMGRIDCVVANAGIGPSASPFVDMTSEMYHRLLAINQHGAFYTLREGARHMKERADAGDPGGSLIACGSLTNFLGMPHTQEYAAAKAAVAAMIRGIAVEYGRYGIRANVLVGGFIKSAMTAPVTGEDAPMTQMLRARCPVPRWGEPEDMTGAIVYLMSDASSYHTGDTLVIDGGWSISVM